MGLRMAFRAATTAAFVTTAFVTAASPALAQKQGGTLRVSHRDNPPSASIHDESTISVNQPFMAVFNNLVGFDPKERVNNPDHIVPDLPETWAWNDDNPHLPIKRAPRATGPDPNPSTPPTSTS